MKRSYLLDAPSDAASTLGRQLVDVLIEAGVTFGEAINALGAAETILKTETKPIRG